MPVPVRRIDYGPPTEQRDSLEHYVASRVLEELSASWPDLMVDAIAERTSDYWKIVVFVSEVKARPQAEEHAWELSDDLASRGIPAYVQVKTWTGPWG